MSFLQKKLENYVFAVLSDLVRLDLSHCGLTSIQPRAFSGLDSLEWLHLNDNQLNAIHPTALLPLKAIHGLHLHANPWNCSCGLRPTLEWMQEKNVVPNNIPPTCHQPARLQSKSWNSLTLDDFACPPAIVKAVQILEQKARQLDYLLDATASEV